MPATARSVERNADSPGHPTKRVVAGVHPLRWMRRRVASSNNRVLLINTNRMQPVVAPIALDYLGTFLRNNGYDVALLDLALAQDHLKSVEDHLEESDPLAVGVTVRNTDDCYFASQDFFLPEIKQVVDFIKKRTSAPVVLGGCGFSIMPAAVLDYCGCELGIRGDGEVAFLQLLDALQHDSVYTGVPGLVYRVDGRWRMNPTGDLLTAQFEPQRRDVVDNVRYLAEGGMGNIETKRGCDRKCIYCADPVIKGRVARVRSPQAVVDEIEALLDQRVDVLHTCDSEFNLPPTHATAVCEEIVSRKLGGRVRWYTYMSPKPFTAGFASLLKRAGCVGINFGVDSGSDVMLKRLARDFTAQDILDTAGICRDHKITFMFDLLLGGPGENRDTVTETVALMRQADPDRVGAAVGIRMYPGTPLARAVKTEGSLEQNPNLHGEISNNSTFLKPVFYLSKELGPYTVQFVTDLIGDDERFFMASPDAVQENYNYNENRVLVEAIRNGYRGAYWDILRRLARDRPAL